MVVDLRKLLSTSFDEVPYHRVRGMIGLGWHEASVRAWLMFLLGSVELRACFQCSPRNIPIVHDKKVEYEAVVKTQRLSEWSAMMCEQCFADGMLPILIDD